ncbi:MAG: NAD(P)-binding protein, partial [Actinomycetia bacterium]|nr:NAD(P)-binding protein [Actinomycetes bacterium]
MRIGDPPRRRHHGDAGSVGRERDPRRQDRARSVATRSHHIGTKTVGNYDTIIVGAGHNGLVAAAYLAQAGRKVLVLERAGQVGGAAVTEEIFPGFRVSAVADGGGCVSAKVRRDLMLDSKVEWIESEAVVFSPQPGG